MEGEKETFDYIVTPFPEKIAKILHLPYPVTWLIISVFLFVLHAGACYYSGSPLDDVLLLMVLAFLPSFIASGIIWFSKALERFTPSIFLFIDWPKEKILEWYKSELWAIFSLKWMVIVGVILSGICLGSMFFNDFWLGLKNLPKMTYGIMMAVIGFLGGGMLYAMIRIAVMVNKMGKLEAIKVSIYQHPITSVKAVGNLLSRIALIVIGIYLFGISSVFIEAGSRGKLILGIVGFFGVIVIAFFIFPQIRIHQIMSKVKHMRLRKFSRHVEEAFEHVTTEPSRDNIQRVRELFNIQESLSEMGEWPFDSRYLFLIITGIAIPLIVVLLQIICGRK
jgi:hypothetical protein